jgi:hypothetical protein
MIDDPQEVRELLAALEAQLPMQAYPTPGLVAALHQQRADINLIDPVQIDRALYLGDTGGIACAIAIRGGKNVLVTSITHLNIDKDHPLAGRIRAYQMRRTKHLMDQSDHGQRRSWARRALKQKR